MCVLKIRRLRLAKSESPDEACSVIHALGEGYAHKDDEGEEREDEFRPLLSPERPPIRSAVVTLSNMM